MIKDVIELICMIDKSISMDGREKQVVHCYNSLIAKYKVRKEKCFVTTCLFSEKVNMICLRNEISFVNPLSEGMYYVEGSTALYDTVNTIFSHEEEYLEYLKDEINKQIHVYIITDGIDNGSVEIIHEEFESLIRVKEEKGWKIHIAEPK